MLWILFWLVGLGLSSLTVVPAAEYFGYERSFGFGFVYGLAIIGVFTAVGLWVDYRREFGK